MAHKEHAWKHSNESFGGKERPNDSKETREIRKMKWREMEWGGEEKEREEKGGKEEQSALLYVNWLSHWWLGRVMMTSSNTWTWCQHFYMCARTHTHTHTQYSHNHSPTHLHISIHIEKHASYSQHAYTHAHIQKLTLPHPQETGNSVKVWWCIIFFSTSIHLSFPIVSFSLLFTPFISGRQDDVYLCVYSNFSAWIFICGSTMRDYPSILYPYLLTNLLIFKWIDKE